MPIEFDDQSIRVIGNNVRALQFYDNERNLQQEIFLQNDNTLNIGNTDTTPAAAAAVGVHALDGPTHTGALGNAQGPQFVLVDGSRDLTGNLDVDAGVTIDGVDISAHAADDDAHHDPVTLGAGGLSAHLGLSTQELTLTDIDHNELSSIAADDHHDPVALGAGGLSAHLNLSTQVLTLTDIDHNELSSIAADDHHDPVTIGAGGLSAKLSLSTQELTLAAINHSDISNIAADDHHDPVTAGNGIALSGQQVSIDLVSAWSGLKFSGGDLRVDLDASFTWTGAHEFQAGATITDGQQLNFGGDVTLKRDGANQLALADGDAFKSDTFTSGWTGNGYRLQYVSSVADVELDRILCRQSLNVSTFVVTTIQALNGVFWVTKATALATAIADSDSATSITVDENVFTFTDLGGGDYEYDHVMISDANGNKAYYKITSTATGSGPYTYNVTHLNGDNIAFSVGDAVVGIGTWNTLTSEGGGHIELDSVTGTYNPFVDVRQRQSDTYNDIETRVRIGELDPSLDSDLSPSGWGLFADNVYLKGSLSVAGGDVVLNDSGLSLKVGTSETYVASKAIKFFNSTPTLIGALRGYEVTGIGTDSYMLLSAEPITGQQSTLYLKSQAASGEVAYTSLLAQSDVGLGELYLYAPDSGLITLYFGGNTAASVVMYDGGVIEAEDDIRTAGGLAVGYKANVDSGDIQLTGQIISLSDTNTYIDITTTADRMSFYCGGVETLRLVEDTADYIYAPVDVRIADLIFVNDSANTFMTQGITINQGANDDEILTLKSSDVAHSCTSRSETDTFLAVRKMHSTYGGVSFRCFSESYYGIDLQGTYTVDNTTKTTSARGPVEFLALKISGASFGNMGTNANAVVIRVSRNGTAEAVGIWDKEGDYYYDGSLNNYDDENDALAAWDLSHILAGEYNKIMEYNATRFERMRIIGPADKNGRRMVSHKRMTALQLGAIGQAYFDRQQLWNEVILLREKCQQYGLALRKAKLLPEVA